MIEVADATLRHDLKDGPKVDSPGGASSEVLELDEAASVNGIAVPDMLPAPE